MYFIAYLTILFCNKNLFIILKISYELKVLNVKNFWIELLQLLVHKWLITSLQIFIINS